MGLETNKVKYRDSWRLLRLKELCTRISDGVHFTPDYVSEGVPFISVKDIFDDKVNFEKCKYITKDAHKELIKRCFPEKDDILITKSGTIGRMALVPDKPEFSLFVSVALLKNKKDLISSKFLKYCLENFLNHINISQDIKGGLLKNFHLEDIRETLIPEVSLIEQQTIVTKIEELFSQLENGKQQLLTAQKQLKTYRQSLLKNAFEVKKRTTVGELFDFVGGGTPSKKNLKYWNGDIPWASVKDIKGEYLNNTQDKISQDGLKNSASNIAKSQDVILITRISPGKVIISNIETAINQDLKIVKPKFKTTSKFVYFIFKSIEWECVKKSSGTTVLGINLTNLKEIQIPQLSYDDQVSIVLELESKLTICDKIEETIKNTLQQSETLRQSILKKAFEGRLV